MSDKPGSTAGNAFELAVAPDDEPGRLNVDDRGNITWEWNQESDILLADDTLGAAARVRALVDPSLNVAEDSPDPLRSIQCNPIGLKTGYDPYDSGTLSKQMWKKKKDLREFSKWIELRRKLDDKA
jgi:hypothetical protein